MKTINLIFPHQLFEKSELLKSEYVHFLIEEHLFFNQYKFHSIASIEEHLLVIDKFSTIARMPLLAKLLQ